MGALTRQLSLLAATAMLVAACGGSNSSSLLGPSHGGSAGTGTGGIGAGGTAGPDAGLDAAADSSAGAGGTATGGSAGSGGSTAGAGGTTGSAGAGGSGGTAGSAGAGPTPGVIDCAGTPCSTGSSVCCTCPNCTIPFPTTCYPKITGCTTGKPMYCDDATDCPTGHLCCAHFDAKTYKFNGASCDTSCPSNNNAVLCKADSQCKAALHCTALASLPGFKACQ